jgi:hypothetical protein
LTHTSRQSQLSTIMNSTLRSLSQRQQRTDSSQLQTSWGFYSSLAPPAHIPISPALVHIPTSRTVCKVIRSCGNGMFGNVFLLNGLPAYFNAPSAFSVFGRWTYCLGENRNGGAFSLLISISLQKKLNRQYDFQFWRLVVFVIPYANALGITARLVGFHDACGLEEKSDSLLREAIT